MNYFISLDVNILLTVVICASAILDNEIGFEKDTEFINTETEEDLNDSSYLHKKKVKGVEIEDPNRNIQTSKYDSTEINRSQITDKTLFFPLKSEKNHDKKEFKSINPNYLSFDTSIDESDTSSEITSDIPKAENITVSYKIRNKATRSPAPLEINRSQITDKTLFFPLKSEKNHDKKEFKSINPNYLSFDTSIDESDTSSEITSDIPKAENITVSYKIRNKATRSPAPLVSAANIFNTTTIETTTWKYRGNDSSEENDESKTTLIDYPFSASIQRKGAHYTSGAILNKQWILSSAGDFYNVRESMKLFRARLGSVNCKRGGVLMPIQRIEIHPYYLLGKPNFDVALIRLGYPIDYSKFIRPIAISNITEKVISAKFMTTYWPRIMYKDVALPSTAKERLKFNSMRVSTQKLQDEDKCSEIIARFNVSLNEASLCMKPIVSLHSVCAPDPGAPVFAEDGLWGITSGWISPSCPNVIAPTLFTRISSPSVRSWLDVKLLSS